MPHPGHRWRCDGHRWLSGRRQPEPGVGVGGCLRPDHRQNARSACGCASIVRPAIAVWASEAPAWLNGAPLATTGRMSWSACGLALCERVDAPIFAGTGGVHSDHRPLVVMQGCRWLPQNSSPQSNPVGTLALIKKISNRYLGTYLDVDWRASGRMRVFWRPQSSAAASMRPTSRHDGSRDPHQPLAARQSARLLSAAPLEFSSA